MNIFQNFWHETLKRPYKLVKTIETGEGKTVLLIHGLGTSGRSWNPFVKLANKKKWHLLGFDLLGFGKSPKPVNNRYTVVDHARSILASLDRKTKQQKIIIIGHSMGCLVASHIAWIRPDMVDHMILYEPPLFANSPEFRSHKRRRRLYFALYQEISKRPRAVLTYGKLTKRLRLGRQVKLDPDTWVAFEKSIRNTIMSQKAYNELLNVKVPTDIIYGKFDFVVTRKEVKEMLKANQYINFHLVNELHDITDRASRYLLRILNEVDRQNLDYTKIHAGN